jgi:hypothetical protein
MSGSSHIQDADTFISYSQSSRTPFVSTSSRPGYKELIVMDGVMHQEETEDPTGLEEVPQDDILDDWEEVKVEEEWADCKVDVLAKQWQPEVEACTMPHDAEDGTSGAVSSSPCHSSSLTKPRVSIETSSAMEPQGLTPDLSTSFGKDMNLDQLLAVCLRLQAQSESMLRELRRKSLEHTQ